MHNFSLRSKAQPFELEEKWKSEPSSYTIFHWGLKFQPQYKQFSTEIWNLDSDDQSPAIYRHQSSILGAKSGFWEQYLHHPTLLIVFFSQEERFWNSCFFCSCFERGKTHNWKRQTQENAKQICSKWSSNELGPHVEAQLLHGFASPDCRAEYY